MNQKTFISIGFLILIIVIAASGYFVFASTPVQEIKKGLPPQGLYDDSDPSTKESRVHLDKMAKAGFKIVVNYGVFDHDIADIMGYADHANAVGLKVIWDVRAREDGTFDPDYIRERVEAVKDHPATWGYYVADEPGLATPNDIGSERVPVKTLSDYVHQLDPAHPRFLVHAVEYYPNDSVINLRPYADYADVIAVDVYPLAAYAPAEDVGEAARAGQKLADEKGKQWAIVLQSFDAAQYKKELPDAYAGWPDRERLLKERNLTLKNSRPAFILWYSYFDILKSSDPAGHWADLVAAAFSPWPPILSEPSPLKALAEKRGVRFGAFYQYDLRRGDNMYDQVFEREMNVMTVGAFWNVIHRGARTDFDFSEIDATVDWARAHGMELRAQSLVWFDSADIPDWLRTAPTSEVESIMNEHIDAVVGRYAGRIKDWNVVNEAVNDDGTLRQNHKWAEAMGDNYIRKAFVRAHAADPTAVLYYNDYDIESNQAKYEGVKALLISLKNQGAPVHALGWQMHVKPNSFDAATLLAHMNEIADLGFDNYITELDVELPINATAADYEKQKQTYKKIVQTFLAARRHKTIVVWGLRDGDPYWLTNVHPLLFDEKLRKKPAYFGVQEALKASSVQKVSSKFELWQKPSFFRGAAIHPYVPYGVIEGRVYYMTKEDFQALRVQGANVVSLNYPGPFGVSPPYGIDEEALKYLDNAINWAGEVGLYVIIHFRNGPGKSEDTFGSGEGKRDETLWYSKEEKTKWIEMWQFVAQRYQNRSHVIAYNLMVEPHPEDPAQQAPAKADVWNDLAKRITAAIRKVDKETPIIVSATWWSNPIAFSDLKSTGDSRTIYGFHMYEPSAFTHQGFKWAGEGDISGLVYPGMIPSSVYEKTRYWDKILLEEFLEPVSAFQRANNVPIFVGEFGCNRKAPSCVTYLGDLLSLFEKQGWSYTYFLWRDLGDSDGDFDYEKEPTADKRVPESAYMKLFKKYWSKNKFINLR